MGAGQHRLLPDRGHVHPPHPEGAAGQLINT